MLQRTALRIPFIRQRRFLVTLAVISGVALAAVLLGSRASSPLVVLLLLLAGAVLLLSSPILGLPVLILASLVTTRTFSTGTAVEVNPATLLVPVVAALWLLDMMRRRKVRLAPSRVNRPLILFLLAGLLSLALGNAL